MKILLTGSSGFVGLQLLQALLKNNYIVIVLTRSVDKFAGLIDQYPTELQYILTSDLSWKQKVKTADPEVVIHLAAYLTSSDDEKAIDQLIGSNISFSTHLLDALKNTSVRAFINTGTFAEYADSDGEFKPAYLYAATKTAFRYVLEYYKSLMKFKLVNVIPYTIYGGHDTKKKLIDYIYDSTGSDTPINMSPGEQVLDFIHINDVIDLYLTLVEKINQLGTETYDFHLGSGIGSTPKKIASIISQLSGKQPNINWGGLPYRPTDTMYCVAPRSAVNDMVKWSHSINLEEGLSLYIKSINSNDGI